MIFCLLVLLVAVFLNVVVVSGDNDIIYIFLPIEGPYPEYGVREISEHGKSMIEEQLSDITVEIVELGTAHKLISDSDVTRRIVKNYYENTLNGCIWLGHSKVALEMATFFNIPTITYSTWNLLEEGPQIPINPRYEYSTKAIFNVLKEYNWTRVNFVVSTLPWYRDLGTFLYDNIDTFNKEQKAASAEFIIEQPADQKIKFDLDSYSDDVGKHIMALLEGKHQLQTANILVFLGHLCEFRRLVQTAYKQGFLEPGKIVVYMDIFGQMSSMMTDDAVYSPINMNCSHFIGWEDYTDDEEIAAESMKYVIFGITHWQNLLQNDINSQKFDEDYKLSNRDNSGFDLLLIDGLDLLSSYVSKGLPDQTFKEYAKQHELLYSGSLDFGEGYKRDLMIAVDFYHGNGNVNFMRWENNCEGVYCPEITLTGKSVPWVGGIKPTPKVKQVEQNQNIVEIVLPIIAILMVTTLCAGFVTHCYKKWKMKSSVRLWRLDEHNFNFTKKLNTEFGSEPGGVFPKSYKNVRTITGKFKNFDVFIKEVSNFNIDISKNYDLSTILLKQIDITYEHINPLLGIRIMSGKIQIVQPYCSKGSVMDVLKNNPMSINDNVEYKLHILRNVAKGMCYLHGVADMTHGNLKTTNCLVDSRWVVKISDFEAVNIRATFEEDDSNTESRYAQRLWTSPELLTGRSLSKSGMMVCDVYSFAIICFEVLANTMPYYEDKECPYTYSEIIKRVMESSEPPFRPRLKRSHCHEVEELYTLVKDCWDQIPTLRPHFNRICEVLDIISTGEDFGDFIATQMEKYSSGLDQMIKEMEDKLKKERADYEKLLQDMLPKQIASSIKAGRQPPFDMSEVSLYFSDIYNFSSISNLKLFKDDPKLIVEFLNTLYGDLDEIVRCFGEKLYKVETINDSYLVMSGLPVRQEENYLHAGCIANFALLVLSRVNAMEIEGYPDVKIQIRIGIHSGNLAAGVIGKLNPRYCLFGDTVNFTSRLESTGKAFTIHTSINTVELLKKHGDLFKVVQRKGMVTLKNRGDHQTYFVVGMEGFEWELPKATRRLQKQSDMKEPSDTGSISSGRSRSTSAARKISSCSTYTDISYTDTGISSAFYSNRSKKLSGISLLNIHNSVKFSLLLINKMKKPVGDKVDVLELERPSRRAFSEPDGGNLRNFESKKQRMSTPFRKVSDESLYQRSKDGISARVSKISLGLGAIHEPLESPVTAQFVEGTASDADPLEKDAEMVESGMHGLSQFRLSDIYNHDDDEEDEDEDDEEDYDHEEEYHLTSTLVNTLKDAEPIITSGDTSASSTPTTPVPSIAAAPSADTVVFRNKCSVQTGRLQHLGGVQMGLKRYSIKRHSADVEECEEIP